jgi:hypothetical protein
MPKNRRANSASGTSPTTLPAHLEHGARARLVQAQKAVARLHIGQRRLQRLLPAFALLRREGPTRRISSMERLAMAWR